MLLSSFQDLSETFITPAQPRVTPIRFPATRPGPARRNPLQRAFCTARGHAGLVQ